MYEQVGDRKRALAGYEQILKHLNDPEEGERCVDIAREIAKVVSPADALIYLHVAM